MRNLGILLIGVLVTASVGCQNSVPSVVSLNGGASGGPTVIPPASAQNFLQLNAGSQRTAVSGYQVTSRVSQPLAQIQAGVDGYKVQGTVILQK